MNRIKVDRKKDLIIVEHNEGSKMCKDSKLFCGCCGLTLGVLIKDQNLPCSASELIENLIDVSFKNTNLGLMHEKCGHTMFTFRGWEFIPLVTYEAVFMEKIFN